VDNALLMVFRCSCGRTKYHVYYFLDDRFRGLLFSSDESLNHPNAEFSALTNGRYGMILQ